MHILIFLFLSIGYSAETDGFTSRYQKIPDALPQINHEINQRMKNVISDLNKEKKCNWNKLHDKIGEELRWPFQGKIENYITCNNFIPKSKLDYPDSIYKNLSLIYYGPIKIGTYLGIGFTPPIHHQELLIGADKFGHFLDEGYYYWGLVHHWNYTIEEVLEAGIFTENYLEGKLTGGVFSYADLAANYNGYLFWTDMLGPANHPESSRYFSCKDGLFYLKEEIDLTFYIDPAWDEGMNCNEYRSETMKKEIEQAIFELEAKGQKRYQCPVFPEKVSAMILKYGKYAEKILSPQILQGHFNN